MNCCGKLFNLTIFVCNFLFFLTGCAILGMGAYMQANIEHFGDFMVDYDVDSSIILMVLGGVILSLAFLGCCGACTENACMMYTYACLIAIILVCEIGAAVALLVFKDDVAEVIEKGLIDGLDDYGVDSNVTDGHTGTTHSWDELQTNLKCCGVKDFKDWGQNPQLNSTNSVPDSCCKTIAEDCGNGKLTKEDPQDIYTDGCLTEVFHIISENAVWVAVGAACIVAIQLTIVCVACCLGSTMKKAQYERK